MLTSILIGICSCITAYFLWQHIWYRPPNFPPGPPRLPLFGSYLLLLALNYRHMHRAVQRLSKFYGSPIIGFYHGPLPVVVCNDIPTVRELLRNPALDGKQNIVLTNMRSPDQITRGIIFTEGSVWHENRRFSLRHMRDFGFGRRQGAFEMDIAAEMSVLLDVIRDGPKFVHEFRFARSGGVMLCPDMFLVLMGNALMRAMCSETFGREDHALLYEAGVSATAFAVHGDAYGRLFSILPFLPRLCPEWCGYGRLRRVAVEFYEIMERIVQRKKEAWDGVADSAEGGERNFLEHYFKEIRDSGNEKSFNVDQLVMTCVDLLLPAFTTLSSAMSYMVQRWCAEPLVLQRIQAELDAVVGQSRHPTLDDRASMPYTEAAIRECIRLRSPVPSAFPHKALHSTKLAGYDVPQGALIVTNLQAAHWDVGTFADALQYRPERFLGPDGRLTLAADVSLPFGTGKRLCPGETFSRNMLFVVTATLAQQFDVRVAPGSGGDWSVDVDECRTGIVSYPRDMWVKFEQR